MSLTLFTIEDYIPILSDEALLIEEFKVLHSLAYNKAKGDTQGRERKRAIKECRYIYHLHDYRSEYSEYPLDEREAEAIISADLPKNFKPSEELEACIKVFISLQETRMLKVLSVAEGALDKIRGYYASIDFDERDEKNSLVHKPKDIMASIADLGNVNKKLMELQKKVKSDLKDTAALRGDHESGFDGAQ